MGLEADPSASARTKSEAEGRAAGFGGAQRQRAGEKKSHHPLGLEVWTGEDDLFSGRFVSR